MSGVNYLVLLVRVILTVNEWDIVDEVETDIDRVLVIDGVFVLGLDVAIGEPDLEYVGDIEYVSDGVGDLVKGKVVGIPDFVMDIVVVLVKGNVVGIEEGEREYVGDIEYVIDGVCDFVKGRVVGIPVVERLIVREVV